MHFIHLRPILRSLCCKIWIDLIKSAWILPASIIPHTQHREKRGFHHLCCRECSGSQWNRNPCGKLHLSALLGSALLCFIFYPPSHPPHSTALLICRFCIEFPVALSSIFSLNFPLITIFRSDKSENPPNMIMRVNRVFGEERFWLLIYFYHSILLNYRTRMIFGLSRFAKISMHQPAIQERLDYMFSRNSLFSGYTFSYCQKHSTAYFHSHEHEAWTT